GKIDEAPGLSWLQGHLDYSVAPLLDEPWVLDVDTTIKPLYGEQEGAELGYNPHKPGRPSHGYHTYLLSNLRLLLSVDGQRGRRLGGWSRHRRAMLARLQLGRLRPLDDQGEAAQPRLGFAVVGPDRQVWEYAALVTSLTSEILTLGQLYRDRADCENTFDELKNQWGWGGFTTHDLKRCRLLARSVALIYNWWSLFV